MSIASQNFQELMSPSSESNDDLQSHQKQRLINISHTIHDYDESNDYGDEVPISIEYVQSFNDDEMDNNFNKNIAMTKHISALKITDLNPSFGTNPI